MTNWEYSEELYIKEEHSFPMVTGLTPVVNLVTIESQLLGHPFTGNHFNTKILTFWTRNYPVFLYKISVQNFCTIIFSNDEFHIILNRRNLESCKHSSFLIIDEIDF